MRHFISIISLTTVLILSSFLSLYGENEVLGRTRKSTTPEQRSKIFSEAPVPDEIREKLLDHALSTGDGGTEYWLTVCPNDQTAGDGSLAIYICNGEKPNTHVKVYNNDVEMYSGTLNDPYWTIAIAGVGYDGIIQNAVPKIQQHEEVLRETSDFIATSPLTKT